MTRTIVGISSIDKKIAFSLEQPPASLLPGEDKLYRLTFGDRAFQLVNDNPPQPQAVMNAGRLLYEKLHKHPPVARALDQALQSNQNTTAPLYILLEDGRNAADALPWEALYTPQFGFLALDDRWPVGRIAGLSNPADPKTDYMLSPPLKMLVVLAASGLESIGGARPEWDALYNAVQAAPFPVELQVLVCEHSLKEYIEGLAINGVSVNLLASKDLLKSTIQEFKPQILHFFCHGSTSSSPHLLLATPRDWDAGEGESSIAIESNEIVTADRDQQIWLVTLNCCLGAALAGTPNAQPIGTALNNAQSLVRSLADRNFPAVVGMREVIASEVANLFCESFYRSVFEELHACAQAGTFVDVEWAKALYAARGLLCDRYGPGQPRSEVAASRKEWLLPILYVRRSPFRLRGATPRAALTEQQRQDLQEEIDKYRDFYTLLSAKPSTPKPLLDEIQAQITTREAQLNA